ncbi:MAG: hypothetical protein AAB478_01950 [Patescibacteria group bacterium]
MIRPDKHYLYYLFLLVMEALIGALIIMSQGDRYMQLVYGLFAAIIYVVWGIIHHLINHTLHKKVVIEYLLMGAVGVSVLYFFLR